MNSPLKIDQALVKEFEVTEELDLEPEVQLAIVRSQLDEFQKVLYRERLNTVISTLLIEKAQKEDKPELEAKFRENLSSNRMMVRQFSQSAKIVAELKRELEAKLAK